MEKKYILHQHSLIPQLYGLQQIMNLHHSSHNEILLQYIVVDKKSVTKNRFCELEISVYFWHLPSTELKIFYYVLNLRIVNFSVWLKHELLGKLLQFSRLGVYLGCIRIMFTRTGKNRNYQTFHNFLNAQLTND